MPRNLSTLAATLLLEGPEGLRKLLLSAARDAGGHRGAMAEALGVAPATLWRHIRNQDLVDEVNAIRAAAEACATCHNTDGRTCPDCRA